MVNKLSQERLGVYGDFLESRNLYKGLFSLVSEDGLSETPDALRRPLIFYLCHTSAFTRRKLLQMGVDLPTFDFDEIFETGISPDDISEVSDFKAPKLEVVLDYIRCFEKEIDKILREKGVSKEVEYALKMGVEHERLHLQTSVPLLMQLDAGFMKDWDWECFDTDFEPVNLSFVEVESGRVSFGSGEFYESVEDFRWDNEQGKVDMDINGFQVSKYPITNTQVVEFIESGGYEVDRYWSENEDSLRWFRESGLEKGCPFNFRKKLGRGFEYRLLGGWIDKVPYSLPAMLNYHEATAICNYLGGRMITELEWMRVHENSSLGNVDMKSFIPMDVRKFNGFEVGNVACWTQGNFAPLSEKKFVVSDLYPEFSREWFNDKHAVLKGVSFAGSGHMLDIEFRDFMQKVMYYPASTYVVKNK